jgi:hypothetical protein
MQECDPLLMVSTGFPGPSFCLGMKIRAVQIDIDASMLSLFPPRSTRMETPQKPTVCLSLCSNRRPTEAGATELRKASKISGKNSRAKADADPVNPQSVV